MNAREIIYLNDYVLTSWPGIELGGQENQVPLGASFCSFHHPLLHHFLFLDQPVGNEDLDSFLQAKEVVGRVVVWDHDGPQEKVAQGNGEDKEGKQEDRVHRGMDKEEEGDQLHSKAVVNAQDKFLGRGIVSVKDTHCHLHKSAH